MLVLFPLSLCAHTLCRPKKPEIPLSLAVDETSCTRLLGFLISPWISILLHSDSPSTPFSIIFRPQPFRSVIVFRLLALVQAVEVSRSIESSRRADDIFDDCFFLFSDSLYPFHGAADHSVSKRFSDGGYSYVLRFSEFASWHSLRSTILASDRKGQTEGDAIDSIKEETEHHVSGPLIADTGHPWTRIIASATHHCVFFFPLF